MNSNQFCYFDNFNSQRWVYYSIGFWLFLALKLTIKIIGRVDMVGTKMELGGGWKKFAKLIMLIDMKDFCCLNLKCYVVLFYIKLLSNMFEFICDPSYGLPR